MFTFRITLQMISQIFGTIVYLIFAKKHNTPPPPPFFEPTGKDNGKQRDNRYNYVSIKQVWIMEKWMDE